MMLTMKRGAALVAATAGVALGIGLYRDPRLFSKAEARTALRHRFVAVDNAAADASAAAGVSTSFADAVSKLKFCSTNTLVGGAGREQFVARHIQTRLDCMAKDQNWPLVQIRTATISYNTGDVAPLWFPGLYGTPVQPVDTWLQSALDLPLLTAKDAWTRLMPPGHNVLFIVDEEATMPQDIMRELTRICADVYHSDDSYLTIVVVEREPYPAG